MPAPADIAGMTGTPASVDIAELRDAHEQIRARIATAASRSGRDAGSIRLVAVSKTVPIERLRAAVEAGISVMGENRVQEAMAKVAALPGVEWHLVGQLQGNKAGRAIELFDVIQSIDSVALAERLSRLSVLADGLSVPADGVTVPGDGQPVRGLLQVNVDADTAKAGFSEPDLDEHLERLLALPGLRLEGLMTVGRLVEHPADARPTFVALRRLSERLRAGHPSLGPQLSMGMSDDFDIAVEEGATIVRVGRALFGERPVPA